MLKLRISGANLDADVDAAARTIPPRPFLLPTAQRLAPDLASSIGQAVAAAIDGSPVTAAAISHGGDAPDPDGIYPYSRWSPNRMQTKQELSAHSHRYTK